MEDIGLKLTISENCRKVRTEIADFIKREKLFVGQQNQHNEKICLKELNVLNLSLEMLLYTDNNLIVYIINIDGYRRKYICLRSGCNNVGI